jgi:hypothetical protein
MKASLKKGILRVEGLKREHSESGMTTQSYAILPFKRYVIYDYMMVHEFILFNDGSLLCIDIDEDTDTHEQVKDFLAEDGFDLESMVCVGGRLIVAHVSGRGSADIMRDVAPISDCLVRRAIYDTIVPLDCDADSWAPPAELDTSFHAYYENVLKGETGFGFPSSGGFTMFGTHVSWESILPHLAACGGDSLEERLQELTL